MWRLLVEHYSGKEKKVFFSIDRLTIMATLKNTSSFYHIYKFINHLECSYYCRHADSSMFEFSYNVEGLGYVQFDRENLKLRVDFNPNKITLSGKELLCFLLSFTTEVHYSRLDLAMDLYNYEIHKYNIVDIGNRKSAYFYDRVGNLETMYSGSMKSNKYIRIYNKAVEQRIKGNIDWWRFEIQLRDVYIDKYLNEISDFYKNILVYQYNCYDEHSVEENAMIDYLLRDTSRFSLLSKNTRTKYKKIIQELRLTSIDFFDDILNIATPKIIAYLNYLSNEKIYPDNLF